jgi:hypothetical protein
MILLDVRAFKGERHRATGILDTEVYQKEMNLYLYTPPTTEHPRSSHHGLIKGEMIRYITKSSSFKAFVDIACMFYQRLRARGFSSALLAEAFSKAPSYDIRESLLTKALAPRSIQINDLPVKIFSPIFSRSKVAAGLPRAILFWTKLAFFLPGFPQGAPCDRLASQQQDRRPPARLPLPSQGGRFRAAGTVIAVRAAISELNFLLSATEILHAEPIRTLIYSIFGFEQYARVRACAHESFMKCFGAGVRADDSRFGFSAVGTNFRLYLRCADHKITMDSTT